MEDKVTHITKAIMRAAVGFIVGVLVYLALVTVWWQAFPYKTADVIVPMTVLNENKEVRVGEKLRLELTFTKYTESNPEVSRNIYCLDGSVHFPTTQSITGTARPVGTFTARPEYGLPSNMPTDVLCFFQFTNRYQVNPIRTISKVWNSESFIVKE